ncbi:MAG: ferrous iron transport protein B [Planctomycetaceae bacterium]|nr:ferrous iron transport protein B [Planctomycetaceae bacterium]
MKELPVLSAPPSLAASSNAGVREVALIGNPNAGKTTLFNALTGLRAKTANFPGITVDVRKGRLSLPEETVELVDLPGLYGLDALSPEEMVAEAFLRGDVIGAKVPDVVLLVLDATNLSRNLFLASEVLELKLPTIVALNLIDAANAAGISIDVERLSTELGCPIVPVSARTGEGLDKLRLTLEELLTDRQGATTQMHPSCTTGCEGCEFAARYDWANQVVGESVKSPSDLGQTTARVDRWLTNPFVGIAAFVAVMLGVFYLIFALADVPMTLIDEGFARIGNAVDAILPDRVTSRPTWMASIFASVMAVFAIGYRLQKARWSVLNTFAAIGFAAVIALLPVEDFQSLLINGVIAGVGGVVVFLPQICILFFFISLLEDSGYMARAAFVMERLMRAVGLPGKAFVPMLSAHACAIPGIMATRVIENRRDRLVTIIVLPLLTCSARLPVYTMVAALLFTGTPATGAIVFVGAYVLGVGAALSTSWVLKKSLLRGEAEPLVLELPPYRRPSLRNALLTVLDRATIFLKKAGTVILLISVVLWAMATYPKLPEDQFPAAVADLQTEAETTQDETLAEALLVEADHLAAREQLEYSFAGRLGRAVQPVFAPLGFDWRINVGVISSFAAREVVVSTLSIMYGLGEEGAEEDTQLVKTLHRQTHDDGRPVFTTATCLSLLVFYVLAMQCLPTQVVTSRETGSWKWAIFQLVYMTLLAYSASLIVYQGAHAMGIS